MLDWEFNLMTELRLADGEPDSREPNTDGSKPSQTEMTRLDVTERSAFTAS